MIEVEYVHELGLHESKTIVINPTINGVRNTTAAFQALGLPVLGGIRDYMSIGRSRYDAMNVSYRKRLSKRYSVNASYVLSKALAYNGNSAAFGNGPTDELNWFAPHDLGPTPADERHRITISGLVNLHWGITFTPIMQWATGRPYNITEGITDVYQLRQRCWNHSRHRAEQRPDEPHGDRELHRRPIAIVSGRQHLPSDSL